MDPVWLALPGFLVWLVILFLPWRPWSTRESLDPGKNSITTDLSRLSVLIPARNEQHTITRTLRSIASQGNLNMIIVVDDQSTDNTVTRMAQLGIGQLNIIHGTALPSGWIGKLWAQQQGLDHIFTEYTLLLDADIELQPGMVAALLEKLEQDNLDLVSVMALLRMRSLWEKVLMPAFIYFFKLLYPFQLSNSGSRLVAAAAGGCILVRTHFLRDIGGFTALRGALIDDCTLARHIRNRGGRTWIGLTHAAISHRCYDKLGAIWNMVTRTAYTQLKYSVFLLLLCTFVMLCAWILPLLSLFSGDINASLLTVLALITMWLTYTPTLKYYGLSQLWVFTLPFAGVLYLLMTWDSARHFWHGAGAEWKGRTYSGQQ